MSNELHTSKQSGVTVYAIIRRPSDGYVWQTTSSTFVVWVNGNVANYDVALTDRSGDFYSTDFPSAITSGIYQVNYYYQAGGSPATSDDLLESTSLQWNGLTVTGSPSVGANQTTVGELRAILQINARNAGVIDSANVVYSLVTGDYAIQRCLERLIRRTHITQRFDSVTMSDGASTIDFSTITGFSTERIMSMSAIPADGSQLNSCDTPTIDVISTERIDRYRDRYGTQTGHPVAIGFTLIGGTNRTAREADQDYTVKTKWWSTLSSWTVGDTGASTTIINLPGDAAKEAVALGGVLMMQGQEIEHLPVINPKRIEWEALVQSLMGAGNLGERSFQRMSASRYRSESYSRCW